MGKETPPPPITSSSIDGISSGLIPLLLQLPPPPPSQGDADPPWQHVEEWRWVRKEVHHCGHPSKCQVLEEHSQPQLVTESLMFVDRVTHVCPPVPLTGVDCRWHSAISCPKLAVKRTAYAQRASESRKQTTFVMHDTRRRRRRIHRSVGGAGYGQRMEQDWGLDGVFPEEVLSDLEGRQTA